MDKQEIVPQLEKIIGDYLKSQGLILVEIIYRYEGRDLILRILADRPEGGITLDECYRLNKGLSIILDEEDILKEGYILEISSPGLDRPLEERSDFLRCLNRKARFFLSEKINGKLELEGIITKVEDDSVCIDAEGKIVNIPLAKINKAKQLIENI